MNKRPHLRPDLKLVEPSRFFDRLKNRPAGTKRSAGNHRRRTQEPDPVESSDLCSKRNYDHGHVEFTDLNPVSYTFQHTPYYSQLFVGTNAPIWQINCHQGAADAYTQLYFVLR